MVQESLKRDILDWETRPARHSTSFWRRLMRNRLGFASLIFIVFVVLAALIGPLLYTVSPTQAHFDALNQPPSRAHLLGTDRLGHDTLARVLAALRVSLLVAFVVEMINVLLGGGLGLLAGYFGGLTDTLIARLADVLFAFPGLLLAIAIASALGPGPAHAALAIGLVGVPPMARLVRATALSASTAPYVEAARALGASLPRLLARHLLPAVTGVIVVRATLGLGAAVLAEAGLSFLGLGAQPPEPSWGNMLSDGQAYLRRAPSLTVLPGLCIMATVLAFNLVGDALRDALDPRLP